MTLAIAMSSIVVKLLLTIYKRQDVVDKCISFLFLVCLESLPSQ